MDELDKKILDELQTGGFQKSEKLAVELGIGARTIRRRISAMTSSDIIKVVAVPNPIALGYKVWANIGIKVLPMTAKTVAYSLTEHSSIHFVTFSAGKFDFMIGVYFESLEKLTQFVDSYLMMIPGIQSVETLILTQPRKHGNFYWPAPATASTRRKKEVKPVKVDDVDRKIVDLLTQDGLTPPAISAIKSNLNLSEGTIRKHINDMMKHGVIRIEAVTNPAMLGFEVWSTIGITVAMRTPNDVLDSIIKNPSIYLASTSIGQFNIILVVRFHSIDAYIKFINLDLFQITGVNHVESFLHTKPIKYRNVKWDLYANGSEE